MRAVRTALLIVFWASAALIVWTQIGYALLLAALARLLAPAPPASRASRERPNTPHQRADGVSMIVAAHNEEEVPWVSLIVAAHDEQAVIATKVANALALDYPRELLELIVACDGCTDATAQSAREAGADLVLELPRGGKIVAQDAAVEQARGEIVAFSDANALWDPDALRELVSAFDDPRVGYACGRVRFVQSGDGVGGDGVGGDGVGGDGVGGDGVGGDGVGGDPKHTGGAHATNQEGVYWRYEMALRARESRLHSITAGNGAIYATRRHSYIVVDPIMGHDLSFPFNMVKRGWRAVDVPSAGATEKMVPSIEGEWRRKRRMMSHTWPIVVRGGMLSPRGYTPAYALMILSHRLLRYLTPFLHVLALAANVALVADGTGALYTVTLALQLALLAAAALASAMPVRLLLIARYYVLTAASPAAGLWDWLRHGTAASWDAAEGTR
jgi:cellulose synthase/poly-beta-1,6-N-acetylglucosamine synthase-like glycosyltransferase